LIQVADEFWVRSLGAVGVAPVDAIVVVPDVTAAIVICPEPVCMIVIEEPIG
jgi:hypothetical protein